MYLSDLVGVGVADAAKQLNKLREFVHPTPQMCRVMPSQRKLSQLCVDLQMYIYVCMYYVYVCM